MGTDRIRHLKTINGRFYFEPSPAMRRAGFRGEALGADEIEAKAVSFAGIPSGMPSETALNQTARMTGRRPARSIASWRICADRPNTATNQFLAKMRSSTACA